MINLTNEGAQARLQTGGGAHWSQLEYSSIDGLDVEGRKAKRNQGLLKIWLEQLGEQWHLFLEWRRLGGEQIV